MTIEVQVDGRVGHVVIPTGDRLDTGSVTRLADAIQGLADNPSVTAVVLRGSDANFCLGRRGDPRATTEREIRADIAPILRVNRLLRDLRCAVVAAVEGAALGFGLGLVAHCDIVVAATDATFALPELRHRIPPLLAVPPLARRTTTAFALEVALTARTVTVMEAVRVGLVTEIVEPGCTHRRATDIAGTLAELDGAALGLLRSVGPALCALEPDQAATTGADIIAAHLAGLGTGRFTRAAVPQ